MLKRRALNAGVSSVRDRQCPQTARFIAPDPVRAARKFIRDHRSVVRELTIQGMEPSIARSLAGIAALCGKPLKTARTLVQKFRDVEDLVKQTHPQIARSVALAACRATDPIATARDYTANYDRIVEAFERVDPRRARRVANQAFRTDDPNVLGDTVSPPDRVRESVTVADGQKLTGTQTPPIMATAPLRHDASA